MQGIKNILQRFTPDVLYRKIFRNVVRNIMDFYSKLLGVSNEVDFCENIKRKIVTLGGGGGGTGTPLY